MQHDSIERLSYAISQLTARSLMTPIPPALLEDTSVREAIVFLVDKGVTAAPVSDASGHVIGVICMAHILAAQRLEMTPLLREFWERYAKSRMDFFERTNLSLPNVTPLESMPEVEDMPVREVMAYDVYSVRADAPLQEIIESMLAHHVHRVFVADERGILIGIVTSFEIMRAILARK